MAEESIAEFEERFMYALFPPIHIMKAVSAMQARCIDLGRPLPYTPDDAAWSDLARVAVETADACRAPPKFVVTKRMLEDFKRFDLDQGYMVLTAADAANQEEDMERSYESAFSNKQNIVRHGVSAGLSPRLPNVGDRQIGTIDRLSDRVSHATAKLHAIADTICGRQEQKIGQAQAETPIENTVPARLIALNRLVNDLEYALSRFEPDPGEIAQDSAG